MLLNPEPSNRHYALPPSHHPPPLQPSLFTACPPLQATETTKTAGPPLPSKTSEKSAGLYIPRPHVGGPVLLDVESERQSGHAPYGCAHGARREVH